MKASQKQYLKGLAHPLKPVVMIGHKGITNSVIASINQALNDHELIKIKFLDIKEKSEKNIIINELENRLTPPKAPVTNCVGQIGHIAILYRQHADPEKRKIFLPA